MVPETCYHVTPLYQYFTHARYQSVTVNHEIIYTLLQGENQCLAQLLSEIIEGCLLFRPSTKGHRLLGQSGQRNRNLGEVPCKSPVVTC